MTSWQEDYKDGDDDDDDDDDDDCHDHGDDDLVVKRGEKESPVGEQV